MRTLRAAVFAFLLGAVAPVSADDFDAWILSRGQIQTLGHPAEGRTHRRLPAKALHRARVGALAPADATPRFTCTRNSGCWRPSGHGTARSARRYPRILQHVLPAARARHAAGSDPRLVRRGGLLVDGGDERRRSHRPQGPGRGRGWRPSVSSEATSTLCALRGRRARMCGARCSRASRTRPRTGPPRDCASGGSWRRPAPSPPSMARRSRRRDSR